MVILSFGLGYGIFNNPTSTPGNKWYSQAIFLFQLKSFVTIILLLSCLDSFGSRYHPTLSSPLKQ